MHHKTFPRVRAAAPAVKSAAAAPSIAPWPLPAHLMQRAERQSPTREMPVDRLETEGQHQSPAASRALEAPDALAKLLDTGTDNGRAHVLGNGLGGWYVPYLFSSGRRESIGVMEGAGQEGWTSERFCHSPVAPTLALLRGSKELSG